MNVPNDDKNDDIKNSFYKELECVFIQNPTYHMIIFLKDFRPEDRRDDILNQKFEMRIYIKVVMINEF